MDDQAGEIKTRDLHANDYDRWYEEATGFYQGWVERQAVREFLGLKKNDIVLDAGCGTGRFTIDVLAWGVKKVYALDFSPKSIEVLRGKIDKQKCLSIETLVADIKKPLPLTEASVDKAVSIQVMQHLRDEDLRQSLVNVQKVVKDGGAVVVTVYNQKSIWGAWEHWRTGKRPLREGYYADKNIYYRRSTPEELKDFFRSAGFKDIEVRGCVNFPFYRRVKSRWLASFDLWISRFSFSQRTGLFLVGKGVK